MTRAITISLDEEAFRILETRAKREKNVSRAARQLIGEAAGNAMTLRHALNGPLNVITLRCAQLKREIQTPAIVSYVREMEEAVRFAEELVARVTTS